MVPLAQHPVDIETRTALRESVNKKLPFRRDFDGAPIETRTRVIALKGLCPNR